MFYAPEKCTPQNCAFNFLFSFFFFCIEFELVVKSAVSNALYSHQSFRANWKVDKLRSMVRVLKTINKNSAMHNSTCSTSSNIFDEQIVRTDHINIYFFFFNCTPLVTTRRTNFFPLFNLLIFEYLWISILFAKICRMNAKYNLRSFIITAYMHASGISNGFSIESFFETICHRIIQVWKNDKLTPIFFQPIFSLLQLVDDENRAWLLLYDLHMRHFMKRDPKERIREKELYRQSDVEGKFHLYIFRIRNKCWLSTLYHAIEIYKCIWNDRIHLAASLARLRIKNSALSLLHLLPLHLQDNKVAIATANPIVTGWINPFRLRWESLGLGAIEYVAGWLSNTGFHSIINL